MKKKPCATLAALLCAAALHAELPVDLQGLFSPEILARLEKDQEVTAFIREDGKLPNLPQLPMGRIIEDKIKLMQPTFGVEVCLLHKQAGATLDSGENIKKIYNTLQGISTLKGILYYSQSRKMMREFFYDAFRIESPEKKTRLPDLFFTGEIPSYQKIFTFQNDSSFGENIFAVSYHVDKDYFLMRMENINQIWYGIFPIIDPGNLVYYILVVPRGEYLLFYSVIAVKGANPFGLMESKAASFYNRIKALDAWFLDKSGLF